MFETWLLSIIDGDYFKAIFITVVFLLALSAAFHAAVYKRHSRAALGWCAFILSSPLLGSLLYFYFGINRINRKAHRLKLGKHAPVETQLSITNKHAEEQLQGIRVTGETLSFSPVCLNTKITPLNTGDEAYPEMLKAIDEAKSTINMFSYIFSWDKAGERFAQALIAAHKRGVKVKLIVDGVGSQKTLSKLKREMTSNGVPFEVFLPVIWRPRYANLRNHRKLLVVDGTTAFTGGLNIGEIYWPAESRSEKVLDFHFKLQGEVVYYLQAAFASDWYFVTDDNNSGQEIAGAPYFHESYTKFEDENYARVVLDGPGDGEEKMRWHFLSAINGASKSIKIANPYFLPDTGVQTALISAALRGVTVDILIPEKLDHAIVEWATFGSLRELLSHNCKVWLIPPPFDHSKLFIVDGEYTSIGSANWDPRSLRLNFELNVEVYDSLFAKVIEDVFDEKKARAKGYELSDFEGRPYFNKVRDGIARMFSPYL